MRARVGFFTLRITRAVKRPHNSGEADFHFYGFAGFRAGLGWSGRNVVQREFINRADFTRDAEVTKAIGAIGSDLRVDYRAMNTVFYTANVRPGKREARGKFLG